MPRIALILALLLICGRTPAQEVIDDGYPVSSLRFPGVDPFGLAWPCIEPFVFESPLDTTYVTADLVAFRRDWQASQTFATRDTPGNAVLGTHDLPFVFQPGLRLLAGRRVSDWFALEASYLGLLDWNESREVRDSTDNALGTVGNLFSPFSNFGDPPLVGFDYNDFASIRVVSTFHNAELNLRQRLGTPPSTLQASALWGLRYINVQDRFSYRTRSLEPVLGGTNTAIDVKASNSLFGVQVGMAVELQIERRAWLLFEAKGMLLSNSARQQTDYTVGPLAGPDATVSGARSQGRATLGGDLAATLEWKVTPAIVARFGYQGIFLDGLALGSDNLLRNLAGMTTNPDQLSDDGHLAYQGPFAGVTVTW